MINYAYFYGKESYYDKYRPSYSKEAIKYLKSYLDHRDVIEVGAGPGNLSKQLLDDTLLETLTTIEPNSSFIKFQHTNLQQYIEQERCIVTRGYAENLGNISAEIVVVGQAVHWFNRNFFLQELERIGCKTLIILENWTHKKLDFSEKYHSNIIRKKEKPFNYFEKYDNKSFENDFHFNSLEQFSGYMLSMSYAPEKPVTLELFLSDCKNFWYTHSQNDCLCIKGLTDVWIGEPIRF